MITGIFGEIGSGKSWLQLFVSLRNCEIKENRLVTNFPINLDGLYHYAKVMGYDYVPRMIDRGDILFIDANQSLSSILSIPRSTVCLDEASVFINARSFASTPKMLLVDLCQSRKMGVDLYYASQFVSQIDVQCRNLTQFVYHCRGMTMWSKTHKMPRLITKNYHRFSASVYDKWVTSKHRDNPVKTRFAYAMESITGPLSCADSLLFSAFDSLSRLDVNRKLPTFSPKYHGGYRLVSYTYIVSSPAYESSGDQVPVVTFNNDDGSVVDNSTVSDNTAIVDDTTVVDNTAIQDTSTLADDRSGSDSSESSLFDSAFSGAAVVAGGVNGEVKNTFIMMQSYGSYSSFYPFKKSPKLKISMKVARFLYKLAPFNMLKLCRNIYDIIRLFEYVYRKHIKGLFKQPDRYNA